jgi:hypothetical protein
VWRLQDDRSEEWKPPHIELTAVLLTSKASGLPLVGEFCPSTAFKQALREEFYDL